MKKIFLVTALFLLLLQLYAQNTKYEISFPNIKHHEAVITLTVTSIKENQPAVFRMSRSSPGRYATHEFGKNIYNVIAFDKSDHLIQINRIDADIYEVPKHSGFVKVQYTLFGNYADGTYDGIDENSVHLNMPATFMWMKGMEKDSSLIEVRFNIPSGKKWSIATQLKPGNDPFTFTAPGLQYFMDSPTKIGELSFNKWTIQNNNGIIYQFTLALEANTNDATAKRFAQKLERITQQAQAVFNETPAYDFGTYTFIASINPYVYGDGMEHRNSTMITKKENFTGDDDELGTFSHEFFHCWNVERIRPKSLEPFNFEKSNMSGELWLAEGFTTYYADLLLKRCNYIDLEMWCNTISQFINVKENTPGGKNYSPVENSRNAVFVDAGIAIDQTNFGNMFASYYPYGAAIALALDLNLRSKFDLSLDSFMQALWKRFGKKEISYTLSDIENSLGELTRDKSFAQDFFAKYIYGHESFDYDSLLKNAHLKIQKPGKGKAWIERFDLTEELVVPAKTLKGSPLYNAGLDINDKIVSIDGQEIKTKNELDQIINSHAPGNVVSLTYVHGDKTITTQLTFSESPFIKVVPLEDTGDEISQQTKKFRDNWLEDKIK